MSITLREPLVTCFSCPSNPENHGNCKYKYAKMLAPCPLAGGYTDYEQIVLTWRKVHLMPISTAIMEPFFHVSERNSH